MIKEITNPFEKEQIATVVLADLPEWFGIPKYTTDYIIKSKDMPFFAKFVGEQAVGFVSLKETSKVTCELFCMGVLKKHHRKSYGKELINATETYAVKHNYKFLQVKTVKEGTYDIYDKTNHFYQSMGFYELEVFPTLWDEGNPCQVFVKSLS